jgi:hypothetical protein
VSANVHREHPWFAEAERMWLEGWSLSAIGRHLGFTGEWMRQHAHLFSSRPWLLPHEFSGLVSSPTLARWASEGLIHRSPSGLYDFDEVLSEMDSRMERPCEWPGCEEPIASINLGHRTCPIHAIRARTYRYPLGSPEQQAACRAATERWKKRNPERALETARRAQRAYQERQRAKRSA